MYGIFGQFVTFSSINNGPYMRLRRELPHLETPSALQLAIS